MDGHRQHLRAQKKGTSKVEYGVTCWICRGHIVVLLVLTMCLLSLAVGHVRAAPKPVDQQLGLDGYMPHTSENTKPIVQGPINASQDNSINTSQVDLISNKLELGATIGLTVVLMTLLVHLLHLHQEKMQKKARLLKNMKKRIRIRPVPAKRRKPKKRK